jgi:hypothetical protein
MSKFFISEYIGYSKLIFLDSKDKYTIINEEMGKWTDGNWYSNDSYKEYNNYVYYGNTKVSKDTKAANANTTSVIEDLWEDYTLDEWDMYDYICDIYGLDPNEDESFKDIEYYMALNNAKDITEFYNILVADINF